MITHIVGRHLCYTVELLTDDGRRLWIADCRTLDEAETILGVAQRTYKLTRTRDET